MTNVLEKIISDKKDSLSLIKKRKTLESLNRNIKELLIENGFNLLEMNNIYLPGTQKFLGYNYWGKATV